MKTEELSKQEQADITGGAAVQQTPDDMMMSTLTNTGDGGPVIPDNSYPSSGTISTDRGEAHPHYIR